MGEMEKRDFFAVLFAFVLMAYAGFVMWDIIGGKDSRTPVSSKVASAIASFGERGEGEAEPKGLFEYDMLDPFDQFRLEGRAAIVIDAVTGEVLFERNAEDQLPLASVSKIMTALVAHESFSATSTVVITEDAIQEAGFLPYDQWYMKDLIDYALIVSSNDASLAISGRGATGGAFEARREAFIKLMNDRAKELGLEQTYFLNESGLDMNEQISGAYGSARDVAFLVQYILREYPDLLSATTLPRTHFESIIGFAYPAQNTNTMIGTVPGALASKTGFTTLAGGNLVVAFEAGLGRPMIAVVLGSSREGRFEDIDRLIWASIYSLAQKNAQSDE